MTTQIPACKNCKHYYEYNEFLGLCKFHYFERPDYINGRIKKVDMSAFRAREDEDYCGVEGKNFEELVVVEEETFSIRKYLKEKVIKFGIFLGVFKND